jgi:membrane-bound lytic murein transglycosylase D
VRVARAVQSSQSEDFWTIVRGRLLKEETRQFVPAIQAATLIAREPERYGFEVTPALPEPFEVVTVPFSLELRVIAKLAELPPEVFGGLNPELLRSVTPPGDYSLKVPQGSGERIREGLERLSDGSRWGIHRVRGRQSLQELARRYRTSPRRLEEINGLTEATLGPGTELIVPIPPRARVLASRSSAARESGQSVHVVRPGETLSGIARQHRVTLKELLSWNDLSETTPIYPGNRLRVVKPSTAG